MQIDWANVWWKFYWKYPKFIRPICPNRPIIWDIFEKSPLYMSIVHDLKCVKWGSITSASGSEGCLEYRCDAGSLYFFKGPEVTTKRSLLSWWISLSKQNRSIAQFSFIIAVHDVFWVTEFQNHGRTSICSKLSSGAHKVP